MKRYKMGRYVVLAAVGVALFAVGLALIFLNPDAEGMMTTLPYLCVGVGSGLFGGNLGTALRNRKMIHDPQAAKQLEIAQKDERNRAIRDKAKAKAYDMMIFVFAAVLLAFTLMGVDPYVVLILVAVYLFFIFTNVYFAIKYNKEM